MALLPAHHDAASAGSLESLLDGLGDVRLVEALVLGSDAERVAEETRLLDRVDGLHGAHASRVTGGWRLVLGTPTSSPFRSTALSTAPDDDPAITAYRVFERYWEHASPLDSDSMLSAGTQVRLKGGSQIGIITGEPIRSRGALYYSVFIDQRLSEVPASQLVVVEPDEGPETWIRGEPSTVSDFARSLTVEKLTSELTDTVYSYRSSRTLYRSYQFRPLLRLIGSPRQRLLIADEVGLGKTIEAGLIWSELEHRSELERVLVVCPSVLRSKWVAEMRNRFDREVDQLATKAEIEAMIARFEDGTPGTLSAVVSVESMRSEQLVTRLAGALPHFDLVIVDEAHVMRNVGTATHALGQVLADAADALLFLSATPLNLHTGDLFALLHLLDEDTFPDQQIFERQLAPNAHLHRLVTSLRPGAVDVEAARTALGQFAGGDLAVAARPEFGELADLLRSSEQLTADSLAVARRRAAELNVLSSTVSRTRRSDVATEFKAKRTPREIQVRLTPEEERLYGLTAEWIRRRADLTTSAPGLAAVMPLRQAASCLPVMREQISRDGRVLGFDPDDADDGDQGVREEAELAQAGLELVAALNALGDTDSKFEGLLEELRELRRIGYRQVMVFSFFRGTLRYLCRRLQDEFRVRVMDGGVKVAERDQLMEQFRQGQFDILLVSEVGSEGLDFEFCGAIVNYDLPWNPMRVEQRIGRIDRFGQDRERIFISNFVVPGTIESDILYRLYQRIRIFEESVGELEPILREGFDHLEWTALRPDLTDEEREREIQRQATAIETKSNDVKDLEGAAASLAGIDELLIEDFETGALARGGYIGKAEIEQLVVSFVRGMGGTWKVIDGVPVLRGSAELAQAVQETLQAKPALKRHRSAQRLPARLREQLDIYCALDPLDSLDGDRELLGPTHPLVVTAARTAAKRLDRSRFGYLSIPSASFGGRFLVLFLVVKTTGYRPALESMPIAVSIDTLQETNGVGDEVLRALAEGQLRQGAAENADLEPALLALAETRRELVDRLQREREARNDAQVRAQIEAISDSFRLKQERARATLEKLRREGKGRAIRAMYEGRIANLEHRMAERQAELSSRLGVTVTADPVAVAVVSFEPA